MYVYVYMYVYVFMTLGILIALFLEHRVLFFSIDQFHASVLALII